MTWTTPIDPVSLTVITVAYAQANLLQQIRHLRVMTGAADPPGSSYLLMSTAVDAVTWSKVTSDAIADGAVTTAKIPGGAVTTALIADLNVTTAKIAAAAIATDRLQDDCVTEAKLADGAVGLGKLQPGVVSTTDIANGAVTTPKIADGAVTTPKLADDAVTSAKIAAQTIVSGDIAPGGVDTANLTDLSVTSAKLANLGVTSAKIANQTITSAQIAPGGVDTANLTNGCVTPAKLASSVAVVPSGLIAAWHDTEATIPSGWTRYAAAEGRLLIGAGSSGTPSVDFGELINHGVAWTHAHTGGLHTHGSALLTFTGTAGTAGASGSTLNGRFTAGGVDALPDAHTHPFTPAGTIGGTTNEAGNAATTSVMWLPLMRSLHWIRKT
jgi:hypothetical protein